MDAKNQLAEEDLRSMGATNPALWIALFGVNQAVHRSEPLPNILEWKFVCKTVQDLYRMSLKDSREFSIVQTLTSIIHQEQVKEEIINRLTLNEKEIYNVSEPCTKTSAPVLSGIHHELETLSRKANELTEACMKIKNILEDLGGSILLSENVADQPIIIPSGTQETIENYLQNSFNTCYPEPAMIAKKFALDPQWVCEEISKSTKNCPRSISPAALFILYLMLQSKGDLRHHPPLYETALTLRNVNRAFQPGVNIYDDIRKSLRTSLERTFWD